MIATMITRGRTNGKILSSLGGTFEGSQELSWPRNATIRVLWGETEEAKKVLGYQ